MPFADLEIGVEPAGQSLPSPGATGGRAGAGRWLTVGLGAVGLALWIVAVATADFNRMNDAGLSSVLGWPYAAGLLLVIAAFVIELATRRRTAVLTGSVIALIVVLYGTASAIEPVARVPDAWIHAGFIRYITVHGHVLRHNDARFDWPGMFSLVALLDAAMGRSSATNLLGWAPLAFELLYLPPLLLLRRVVGVSERAGWLAIVVFYVGNWVEQDYFSPQAVNMLFLLVVVSVTLYVWRSIDRSPDEAGPTGWLRRARRSGLLSVWRNRALGATTLDRPSTAVVTVLVMLVCAASVVSHQLTPVAIFAELVALALTRRLPSVALLVLVPVLMVSWVTFGATDFWQHGNSGVILGGVGHLGGSLSSGVSERVTGTTIHRVVTDLRIVLSAAVVGLAVIGAVLRRARSRTLELLALFPFGVLALQSYGGEATLRSYLYALPFAACLAGETLAWFGGWAETATTRLWSVARRLPRTRIVALGVVLALGAALLTFVRGGNDPYVAATENDRRAVTTVYRVAQPGQILGQLEPYVPWQDQGVGEWEYKSLIPVVGARGVKAVLIKGVAPDWIILTTTQSRYGQIVNGWSDDWEEQAEQLLIGRDHYRVYRTWAGATVLQHELPARSGRR